MNPSTFEKTEREKLYTFFSRNFFAIAVLSILTLTAGLLKEPSMGFVIRNLILVACSSLSWFLLTKTRFKELAIYINMIMVVTISVLAYFSYGMYLSYYIIVFFITPLFYFEFNDNKPTYVILLINCLTIALSYILVQAQILHMPEQLSESTKAVAPFHILFFLILFISIMHRLIAYFKQLKIFYKDLLHREMIMNNNKDIFLSNMSHELRTPLNGIYGALQYVKGSNDDEKEILDAAKHSAEALNVILSDILDIQKLSKGKLEIAPEWVTSKTIFSQLFNLYSPTATLKKIKFTIDIEGKLPPEIYCDDIRLGQILNNIVGNAIKFTNQGGVSVTVSYDRSTLLIAVKDTGIGINAQAIEHLFERFTQADSSISKQFAGTGLGMAITHELVQLMNGTISVNSEVGQGTIFTVCIPAEGRNQPDTTYVEEKTVSNDKVNASILIIDDDPTNRLVGSRILKKHFVFIDTAENGKQALEKMAYSIYDIILCDINMPVMNGEEFIAMLQLSHPSLPVVALTGNAMEQDKQRYISLGFNDVVTKPFLEEKLVETIKRLVFGQG
jgi:signal transduction histidine kinase